MLYKNNTSDLFRDSQYEFKNKKDVYEGLTVAEEEKLRKFLYRLSGAERNFEFYRACTLNLQSHAFNETRQGAQIGLPTTYLSNSKEEFLRDIPLNGFNTLMGQRLDLNTIESKTESKEALEFFIDNCVLSEDAKRFGLALAIAETDNFLLSNMDAFSDFVIFGLCYAFCYSRNRQFKLQLSQRRGMYFGVILSGVCLAVMARFVLYRFLQRIEDRKACNLGLDCAMGSQEFYEKLLNRNQILRDSIKNGHIFFDKDGNYLKQILNLPFITNGHIFYNYMGRKLTDRKIACQKEFDRLLVKLNKEGSQMKVSEYDLEAKLTEEKEKKEWEFFKNIRLKLEDLKNPPSKS